MISDTEKKLWRNSFESMLNNIDIQNNPRLYGKVVDTAECFENWIFNMKACGFRP